MDGALGRLYPPISCLLHELTCLVSVAEAAAVPPSVQNSERWMVVVCYKRSIFEFKFVRQK